MTTLDESEEFTRFEIDGWNRKAKPYANMLGRVTTRWIPAVLEAAGVEAGSDVLDLATGPGQVAAEAAAAGATVVGVDLATSMVALAKELHPNIDFRVGDAQNLEFPDASFDAVTMSFGLAHVPNQARVFAETYRVLRSGGRAVFCTWA
ncbi:MAG: methyltransferase domain-containing protein, partial [Chloroflexi bacterium]|nr:methyltransferase domain-containing protein [Chloroflexota bacterium]